MGLLDKKNLCLLFLLVFILHIAKIPNLFTWLDHRDIEAGRSLFAGKSLFQVFFHPFSDTHFYRPLVSLSHSLNFLLFGLNPGAFHAVSILLHCLVCLSLTLCAKMVFRMSDRGSLLSGFCMGIAPTSFLPAGQISHVSEPLLALFYLASLIFYHLYEEKRLKRYAYLFAFAYAFALLSKESALVFIPATLLILAFYSPGGLSLKNSLRLFSLTILPTVLYLGLRFSVLPSGWSIPHQSISVDGWIAEALINYGSHLLYLLNPLPPKLSDVVPSQSLLSVSFFLYLLLLAGTAWVLFKLKELSLRIPLILLLILLTPTLNILPLPRFFSSHYLYLPSLMFSMAMAFLLTQKKLFPKAILIPWIIVAMVSTVLSGNKLQNDFTLFSPDVAKDSCYREGRFYLGGYFLAQNLPLEAEKYYFESLKPQPGFYAFYDPMAGSIGLTLAEIELKNYSDAEAIIRAIEPNAKGFDLENLSKIKLLMNQEKAKVLGHP